MIDNKQSNIKLQNKKAAFGYADWCVVISLFCIFLILLGEPLRNSTIVSVGSRILIFSVLGFAFLQFASVINKTNSKVTYYFGIFVLSAIFSIFVNGLESIFQKFIPLICFFMLPITLLLYRNVYNIKFVKKLIYRFNLMCTVLWTILSFTSLRNVYDGEFGVKTIQALTLGYSNPNQTGMFLMISLIIAFSAFLRKNKKIIKAIYLMQTIWTFVLVCKTLSRTCIIISVIFLLIGCFKKNKMIGKRFSFVCFSVPLFIAFLLIYGGENIHKILIMGESFDTGRTFLFNKVLSELTPTTFLFGSFSSWIGNNLHNSYFTIFSIFGLVGVSTYILFLWEAVRDYFLQVDKKSSSATFACLGVLAIILHGATESALLTAGMIYSSLSSLIFILTLNEDRK